MTEHTPGPWFVHDFSNPAISAIPSQSDVTVSCDHPATIEIASMGRAMTGTMEEARANARLIAAAPDMLAALKGVVRVADRATVEFDAARAAIARAEGRRSA